MAKRANPTVVGGFVIGAVALVVAAVLVVGSGKFFGGKHQFICFFRGNVNGLKVGAPVKFRGVPIGSVVQVRINLPGVPVSEVISRARSGTLQLPVVIELDENQFIGLGGRRKILIPSELNRLIEAGLRARLSTESLLTGLLYVDLDFYPDTPTHLLLKPGQTQYLEIPSVPTQFEVIQDAALRALARLDKIDFPGLILSIKGAALSIRNLAQSEELKSAIASLNSTLVNLQETSRSARAGLDDMRANLKPLMVSLKNTSDQAALAMDQTRTTLLSLQQSLNPDSPAMYNLSVAAANLAQASRAVRDLANQLQRNPSVLIRGRAINPDHQGLPASAR